MNARNNFFYSLLFILTLLLAQNAYTTNVETIDLLDTVNLDVNAAGPFLLRMDNMRSRLIAANTLTSSLTVINCKDHKVKNIPIGGRGLQHLKNEAMIYSTKTGTVYLIGNKQFHIIDAGGTKSRTIDTEFQFESIAADPVTGNVFLVGRESGEIGFYNSDNCQFSFIKWLERNEILTNKNATPPPPIRKVLFDPVLQRTIAMDGFESMMYIFDPSSCKLLSSRSLPLTKGGRWHLAGYNYKHHFLFLVIETDKRETIEAAKIDISGKSDLVVNLPGYAECTGINYHPIRNEVYIPYDNHPSVHVVNFKEGGKLNLIKVPAYGKRHPLHCQLGTRGSGCDRSGKEETTEKDNRPRYLTPHGLNGLRSGRKVYILPQGSHRSKWNIRFLYNSPPAKDRTNKKDIHGMVSHRSH
jgi:hypothetical protein